MNGSWGEVTIMLTSRNKPLTKDTPRIMSKSSLNKITWQAFERTLLPKPFQTRCIDYSKKGFLSRGDCFEKCLIQSMDEETNGTSNVVPLEFK